jgi:hypothetical protein
LAKISRHKIGTKRHKNWCDPGWFAPGQAYCAWNLIVSITHNSKNQHYVWQHYLNAWAADGTFCCYRHKDKKLFPTQPKVVANETYFYEIYRLTAGDKKFLEDFISRATDERLRELNRDYINMTQLSFEMREHLKSADLLPEVRAALEDELRWAERNLAERYHAGIESKCQDILDSLRNQNDDFYRDEARCADFLYYLSLQYFRTARMRESLSNMPVYVPGHDPRRTAAILYHIAASNVGASLFRERKAHQIIFLTNGTTIPFIVGDQPVINMLDPKATDDLELYYPLSPTLAIVLTKNVIKFPGRKRSVTTFEVESYNYAMYSESEDQIYSNDEAYLRCLVALGKHVLAS